MFECTYAYIIVCMGSVVCPDQTEMFVKSTSEGKKSDEIDNASFTSYSNLVACMERFERQAKKIKTYVQSVEEGQSK